MPPKSKARILAGIVAYVLMSVLFVGLAQGSVRLAVNDWREYQYLQQVGVQTDAKILELTPLSTHSGGDLTYEFEVTNSDGSVQIYIGKGHVFGPKYSQLVSQIDVLVDYDPSNPTLSRISGSYEFASGLINLVPAIAGIIILLLPIFFGIYYKLRHIHLAKAP